MPHDCKCYARMGNDFWFLPANQCLYGEDCPSNKGLLSREPTVAELIEDAVASGEKDPLRCGALT